MVLGVPGQHGQSAMGALVHPIAPESATAPPPGLVGYPALERADKDVDAMTTSPSAQVSITNF